MMMMLVAVVAALVSAAAAAAADIGGRVNLALCGCLSPLARWRLLGCLSLVIHENV